MSWKLANFFFFHLNFGFKYFIFARLFGVLFSHVMELDHVFCSFILFFCSKHFVLASSFLFSHAYSERKNKFSGMILFERIVQFCLNEKFK
jgi:hypothetical protein